MKIRVTTSGYARWLLVGLIGVSSGGVSLVWLACCAMPLIVMVGIGVVPLIVGGVLASLAVTVYVGKERVSVRIWPLMGTDIPAAEIDGVEVVVVDPLRDYGGWGIKGGKDDRLYGFGRGKAVRIHYQGFRQVTILSDDPDVLIQALERSD